MRSGSQKTLVWAAGTLAVLGLMGAGAWLVQRGRPADPPDILIRRAQEAITAGRWTDAESLLGRLAAQPVRGPAVEFLRGQLEDARGHPEAALAARRKIPDEDRLAARARLLAGQIERKRGHARLAETALREAVRLNPSLSQAHRELAFLYGIQGRRVEMDNQFRALAKLVTLDMNGAFLWTNAHEDILFNVANRPILEQFVAADPGDRWSRPALAEVLLRAGDLTGCEDVLGPLAGDDPEGISLRAGLRMQQSRYEEVPGLLARGPTDHPALACLRGQIALQQRDAAKAARQFELALQLNPSNREAIQGLSIALQTLGRKAESAALRTRSGAL